MILRPDTTNKRNIHQSHKGRKFFIFASLFCSSLLLYIYSSYYNITASLNETHLKFPANYKSLIDLGLTPKDSILINDLKKGKSRKLHGRFLHITDIHPDRFYKEHALIEDLCHVKDSSFDDISGNDISTNKNIAPRFGKAMSGCDASLDLMEYTFKWINETLRDKIDFVIWTGDNIRHDNDRDVPRTESQIFEMNEIVSRKFQDLFRNRESENPRDFDVEVVPSLGNNDVFPHNMFSLGPTLQTREMFKIWNVFIPQEQQRFFDRGVTFLKEVIPGKLAVLSINTLYLYKANPLVDNCNSKKEPGYQLLLWLGYTLEELRQRNMKVWLSGHVPPIVKNFDDSCYNKFTLWTYEYRDIIVGGVYGHMNMDHFIPVDGQKAREEIDQLQDESFNISDIDEEKLANSVYEHAEAASDAHLMGAKPVGKDSYMRKVKQEYYEVIEKELNEASDSQVEETSLNNNEFSINSQKGKKGKKKKGKKKKLNKDEIYEKYSIVNIAGSVIPTFNPSFRIWEYNTTGIEDDFIAQDYRPWNIFFEELEIKINDELSEENENTIDTLNDKIDSKKKTDRTIPNKKPKKYPLGPAHVKQLFSPTKFVQFYADLKQIDEQYLNLIDDGMDREEAARKTFKYKVEYTSEDKPYSTKSLLVKDYVNLAANLCENKEGWNDFLGNAFISSGYKDDD